MFVGIVIGFFLPALGAFLFVEMGGMPVATTGKPLPFEKWVANVAIHRAMGDEINRPCPIAADEFNLSGGARVYRTQCEVCHGLPATRPSAIASGLFPSPPQLLKMESKGVTDDSAAETYWKVKNGIRLTGMPGFSSSLSDVELWQVSLLLRHAHDLPSGVFASLKTSAK
jgi:thiosulfate dehydrogenase